MKTANPDPCASEQRSACIALDLVDHLDALVAYWDADQVCQFANGAYRDWFGKDKAEVIGSTLKDLLGPLYELNLPHIVAAYQGHKQIFEREIPRPGGGSRCSLATYAPHILDGEVRGIFVHVADVTPLKELARQLSLAKADAERLAAHDYLTGLPNRVRFREMLDEAFAHAQRDQESIAVVSIDIDDFKRINDTHGHVEGDRFLVEIAARIKGALRDCDTVARFGGDEFLLIGRKIKSESQIEHVARRLLDAVAQPLQVGDTRVTPAVSIGIAIYPRHGKTADALIASSDRALYLAKKLGKNRFASADVGALEGWPAAGNA
jgi:diguanylate cyclase (GGDEF)-like protein/PAS domain S-box-containing protein